MILDPREIQDIENMLTTLDSFLEKRNERLVFLVAGIEEGADVAGFFYVLTAKLNGSARHPENIYRLYVKFKRGRSAPSYLSAMANTEWWQRGSIEGVPALLQPVAHILLQVRESAHELVEGLTEAQWNARPAGVASAAFHVRHMAGVIDRLFTYARGESLSDAQFAAIRAEGSPLTAADVPSLLSALDARVDAAIAELRTIDATTLTEFRAVGRAKLPSTVIGCLVHGAEHAMRHVGQLSVTTRIVRAA